MKINLANGVQSAVVERLGNYGGMTAINPAETTAYVTERFEGELSAVDLATGGITTVASGLITPVADVELEPTSGQSAPAAAYVLDGGRLLKVTLSSGAVTVVAPRPPLGASLAIHPSGHVAYMATRWGSGDIYVVDLTAGTTSVMATGVAAIDVAVDPLGNGLYLLIDDPGMGVMSVARLNLATGIVTTIVTSGDLFRNWSLSYSDNVHLAVNTAGSRAYVTIDEHAAYAIDLTTSSLAYVPGSMGMYAVAPSPDDLRLYGVSAQDQLIEVDRTTGARTVLAPQFGLAGRMALRPGARRRSFPLGPTSCRWSSSQVLSRRWASPRRDGTWR